MLIAPKEVKSLDRGTTEIGFSALGRPITIEHFGHDEARLRLLILAGQHGDEPLARQAASGVSRWLAQNFAVSKVLQACVLENANPDGAANASRKTADGSDLNRDHQLLRSSECEAIHRHVRQWRPHLVLDLHTYPPRRKRLLKKGLQHCHDVLFDFSTHPGIAHPLFSQIEERTLESWRLDLKRQGILAGRYVLVTKEMRVRHSTPDVVDARNALALRYGAWTVLVEGRQPTKREGASATERTREAIEAAVRTIVDWACRHSEVLICRDDSDEGSTGRRNVVIGCRYAESAEQCQMPFLETTSKTIRQVTLPGSYTPNIVPTRTIGLPDAYAIPREHTQLLAILERHGFLPITPPEGKLRMETYEIVKVIGSERSRRVPKWLEVISRAEGMSPERAPERAPDMDLAKDLFFSTQGDAGRALAVHLEPESKFALHRHPESGISLKEGDSYSIRRVFFSRSA